MEAGVVRRAALGGVSVSVSVGVGRWQGGLCCKGEWRASCRFEVGPC